VVILLVLLLLAVTQLQLQVALSWQCHWYYCRRSNTITTTGNANVGNLGFGSGVITGTGNITGWQHNCNFILLTLSYNWYISSRFYTRNCYSIDKRDEHCFNCISRNGVSLSAVAGMVLTITNTSANSLAVSLQAAGQSIHCQLTQH
jgi:hypothetical protein